jgi:hypothetical protein
MKRLFLIIGLLALTLGADPVDHWHYINESLRISHDGIVEVFKDGLWGAMGTGTGVPGPAGPQGIQGEPGATGTPGAKGDQGNPGIAGSPGTPGVKGDKGDTGDTGAASTVPGPQGNPGAQGNQGIQGIQGIQGPAGATIGYTLQVQALTSSPVDAQTVYFGALPKAPITTANVSKVYIPKSGTIKRIDIYCYSGTAGTAEAWSLYVRLNNTTDTLIATLSLNTSERKFSNASLNIAVVAGDYIEIKSIQPTWATNPLTCIYGGTLYIE